MRSADEQACDFPHARRARPGPRTSWRRRRSRRRACGSVSRAPAAPGFSYQLDLAREIEPGAEIVEAGGIKVVIDPKALMFVLGTEVDFVEDRLGAQFVFRNPNEKARCGCGESFSV